MTCKYDKYDPNKGEWFCNSNKENPVYGSKCMPSDSCYIHDTASEAQTTGTSGDGQCTYIDMSDVAMAVDTLTISSDNLDINVYDLITAGKDVVEVYVDGDGEITFQCITDLLSAIKTWEGARNDL